ncbi:MAG: acyl-CoA dehydrogenase family protein [Deltaproteobacteria bacterium]|nr:acyl-CoA dehydrogenase family protein [Deltaproteobacteria bacterium]MBW2361550.1 acyl-CoA dehydrogenase family protein [Deltaproteobacteria bacterium]
MTTPVSEEELIARARSLAPKLAERAERCERERRIPEESIRELKQADLFKILLPKAYGGFELDLSVFVKVAIELGRGCASTAWVYQNNAFHQALLALFPEETQNELWANGDPVLDARIASTGWSPKRGAARPVDGGYVLDGHWEFASGSWNCELDMILAPVERDGAGPAPEMRLFLLDRAAGEYEIVDTWHAMGLRGTASNDIVVRETFVAEQRTLAWADASRTPEDGVKLQGHGVHDSTWYRVPVCDWIGWTIAPALLGVAYSALDASVARLETRTNMLGERLADTQSVQLRLADVAARLDVVESMLLRDVAQTAEAYSSGKPPSVLERATWRRNQCFGARLLLEAVESLLYRGGAHAIYDGDPVQQAYRDVGAGVTHVAVDWDIWGRVYGQALLGLDIATPNFGFFPAAVVRSR